jgi:DNA-binding NarL/FixJ family response regulator
MTKSSEATPPVRSKVLLVDDHPIVRQGLAQLINEEADLLVCGQAEDTPQALKAVAELSPDVAVVDISLKDRSGIDVIKEIHGIKPNLPVLVLSMHDENLQAERALRAGARGYIMKQEATAKVLTAIRRVLKGDIYLSDKMATRMLHQLVDARSAPATTSPLQTLTNRELEVFTLIGQGIGPRDIAERLSLSVKTVEAHREHIKSKLNLKSGNELIRHAMQYVMDHGR